MKTVFILCCSALNFFGTNLKGVVIYQLVMLNHLADMMRSNDRKGTSIADQTLLCFLVESWAGETSTTRDSKNQFDHRNRCFLIKLGGEIFDLTKNTLYLI